MFQVVAATMLSVCGLVGGGQAGVSGGVETSGELVPGPVDIDAALADASLRGVGDRLELWVPVEVPAWAADLGVTAHERVYKGICGPDGAVATAAYLYEEARRDLEREYGAPPPLTTVYVGESPRFAITYDAANPVIVPFYLPSFQRAAEYVDSQLDNRVTIGVSLSARSIPGNVIGSAGSDRYTIPWSAYHEGLSTNEERETEHGVKFSDYLPSSSLPVRYDGSSSTTNETEMVVTEAQLRAVFGDNVAPAGEAVTITLDTDNAWNFFGCDTPPGGGQLSLIDVAVHEITHSLGFVSAIGEGGNNPVNQVSGLDVARFLFDAGSGAVPGVVGGSPTTGEQFRVFPRHGEGAINASAHFYMAPHVGSQTSLEEGNGHQPSHLQHRSSFTSKLGVMDPSLNTGTTWCDGFYQLGDVFPLDDMGWRWRLLNGAADCNGNQVPDILDIFGNPGLDVDDDLILDSCESWGAAIPEPDGPTGLRGIIYNVSSGTDLSGFDPGSVAPVHEFRGDGGANISINFGSSARRVTVMRGAFYAPARDEYALRVTHSHGMRLFVDGAEVLSLSGGRTRLETDADGSTGIAPQVFVQLNQGWHGIEYRALSTGSTMSMFIDWEARNFGAGGTWRVMGASDTRAAGFVDCDGNNVADAFDPDCDGDGVPDACERDCDMNGVPDACENGVSFAVDLGVVGAAGETITLDTCGSAFDTELALWDETGALLEDDDDGTLSGCNFRTSSIVRTLPAGTYYAAVAGYNTAFGSGFGAGPGNENCQLGGSFEFSVGDATETGSLAPGRIMFYAFTIASPDCDGDGTPDSEELDCDGNGVADECENGIDFAYDFGVVGDDSAPIVISSEGSDFDTELGLWNVSGAFLGANDDIDYPDNLQSRIVADLEAGVYYCAFSGFNSEFLAGFVRTNSHCTVGGNLVAGIGSVSDSVALPSGRDMYVRFEVADGPQPCGVADMSVPYGTLDIDDVLLFLGSFANQDPLADVASPSGVFNIDDVLAFLQAFAAGCS